MFPLLDISGIGPKTAYTLSRELELTKSQTAVVKLKEAAMDGKIAQIDGFGEESQSKILSAIKKKQSQEKIKCFCLWPKN